MTGALRPPCVRPSTRPALAQRPLAPVARLRPGAGAGSGTTVLDQGASAAADGAAEALGHRMVARLTRLLRTYLIFRSAAGPESAATRLALRALERACEDAMAFEQDGLAPRPLVRRRGGGR